MNKKVGSVNLFAMAVILVLGAVAAIILPSSRLDVERPQTEKVIDLYGSDLSDPDPYPVTEFVNIVPVIAKDFPKEIHMKLVGRLADGIAKHKIKKGGWWECGKLMVESEEIQSRAVVYAYEIVHAAYRASDKDNDPDFVLNPWGLAGTIGNESRFDRCALGTYPRKQAYKTGLIKRRKRCISHTEDEILKAIQSEDMQMYFKRSGFDLGVAQLLSRFYPNPKGFKKMMSVHEGTLEAAYEMRRRGRINHTDRPWLYWRGYKCGWYDQKVSRWARKLGARSGEI